MSAAAITVENIGKQYRIGVRTAVHRTFRETIAAALSAPWRRLKTLSGRSNGDDLIWSLRDVSFEIQPGEVVGIIGRNGAGKSTLLKILSRITEPTTGRAVIRGRVGSLLEVGTGFHPELTGRENIFLNGAILGMKRAEIRRKFDDIVAFSEITKFLDTPVKRYSSGMYVRLAFAVAAHLEPEILLVDEVLAVGDAAFQKKCLGKLGDVAKGGRTILFVSHNMSAIGRLCQRCLWLDEGRLVAAGESSDVIGRYMASAFPCEASRVFDNDASKAVQIRCAALTDHNGRPSLNLDQKHAFTVKVEIQANRSLEAVHLGAALDKMDGTPVCHTLSIDESDRWLAVEPRQSYTASVTFPGGLFNAGRYTISVGVADRCDALDFRELCSFQLFDSGSFAAINPSKRARPGTVLLRLPWEIEDSRIQGSEDLRAWETEDSTESLGTASLDPQLLNSSNPS